MQVKRLQQSERPSQVDKVKQVSKLYEKQFLREMVKAMRSTVKSSGLLKQNMAEKIFQEKLDHQYVEKWGESGGVGLSDLIYKQLMQRFSGGRARPFQGPIPIQDMKLKGTKATPEGLQIKLESPKNRSGALRAPWPSQVESVLEAGQGQTLIRLRHDQGLRSEFLFSGLSQINTGQKLAAGDELAAVSPVNSDVLWNIREWS